MRRTIHEINLLLTSMKRIITSVFFILTIAVSFAQSDCELLLQSANADYNKGNYEKAYKAYKQLQSQCGSNFGGSAAKLQDCSRKMKEDAAYKKCSTIETCNAYLETYPNGRYVAKVKQKRAELIGKAEEDNAYNRCTTESACAEYLQNYPNGRYVTEVRQKQTELANERLLAEDKAFEQCTTLDACSKYLRDYPNGRYRTEVQKKKKKFDAAKTAYMKILDIEFATSTDKDANNLTNKFGAPLYVNNSESIYLHPRIIYDGLLDEDEFVAGLVYIVSSAKQSGSKTQRSSFWVRHGYGNTQRLEGIYGTFQAGKWTLEIYFNGTLIYQKDFTLIEKENALSKGEWRKALKKCNEYVTHNYDNGSYKGKTNDGIRNGLGMYSYDGKSFYIGHWSNGDRNGTGLYICRDGYTISNCPQCSYFVGKYSHDIRSGVGRCYDRLGNLIYYDNFENSKPTGEYPTTKDYSSYKFECIKYTNGNYYIGETTNGKRDGIGIYIWESGAIWFGPWKNGERNGYGIYMPYSGSFTTGTWNGDEMQ